MALNRYSAFVCRECRNLLFIRPGRPPLRSTAVERSKGRRDASTQSAAVAQDRPLRLGIIGSGPAGFYAAARIIQKNDDAIVDMYEKLPAPFGLVRYGVAPDHPEVKNCQDKFVEVAASPRFNYIGNVRVGDDVPLSVLRPHYDALLFAYGASEDRELGIPGEHLRGVISARAFVGWYNGLPQYSGLAPDLQAGESAYVIGNGNVALDVARILLTDVDVLHQTDISENAIEALSSSKIKTVSVCGRRGPMQAAFTIKEVRELLTLPGLGFHSVNQDLLPQPDYISTLPRLEQRKYRLPQLILKGSQTSLQTASKSWALESLVAPSEFKESKNGDLEGIVFGTNEYDDYNDRFNAGARVHPTGQTHSRPTTLAFRSIGYKSEALNGLSDLGVPFDERRGIIPNDVHGRCLTPRGGPSALTAAHVPGCYCAGWVKRGPTGVIASTMEDAFASADIILRDWEGQAKFLNGGTKLDRKGTGRGWDGVAEDEAAKQAALPKRVSWGDWLAIDRAEEQRGKAKGKPREKFQSTDEMLEVLRH